MKQAAERAGIIGDVRARLAAGATKAAACLAAGVSVSTYDRLSARYDEAGLYGLEDQPRASKPSDTLRPSASASQSLHWPC